jgi:tetratricopeptide (TPR) repeat protein
MQAKQYDQAVAAFTKASEIEPNQTAIWLNLGEANMKLAGGKTGPDFDAGIQKGLEAYRKAVELKPDDPAIHNNYALALAKAKKFPETQAELRKAAELDPASAGKYYFNLGAVLTVAGQSEQALDAFKAAADAAYPPAYCQYGIGLAAKAAPGANGDLSPVPGTIEALQKCLDVASASRNPGQPLLNVGQTWFLLASFGASLPIRKQIADIEESGKYLAMPAPQAVPRRGTSGSSSDNYTIENGTPFGLTVIFSGPASKQVALLPGTTRTVSLPVGTYKVAARVTAPDVLPFFGVDQYAPNSDYQARFYIQ